MYTWSLSFTAYLPPLLLMISSTVHILAWNSGTSITILVFWLRGAYWFILWNFASLDPPEWFYPNLSVRNKSADTPSYELIRRGTNYSKFNCISGVLLGLSQFSHFFIFENSICSIKVSTYKVAYTWPIRLPCWVIYLGFLTILSLNS